MTNSGAARRPGDSVGQNGHEPDREPVNVAVLGVGAIGAYHAETVAQRIPGARLAVVADANASLAERVGIRLDAPWTGDVQQVLSDDRIQAVVIATPATLHAELIAASAKAGKAVFSEKPIAYSLEDADRAIAAAREAEMPLQIGFQRRFDRGFRAARALVDRGGVGRVQVLRSITRDPELSDPARVPPYAVFRETLIHDFDVLRFLNPGAEAVEVYAMADALVRPDFKDRGLLDTAVVTVRFDNGALATADASFQAVYGYDVRAEVFGSNGMASVGDGRESTMIQFGREGALSRRMNWFLDLFGQAYTAEMVDFVDCVRTGRAPACTGEDGRAALALALAAIRSVKEKRPVTVTRAGEAATA